MTSTQFSIITIDLQEAANLSEVLEVDLLTVVAMDIVATFDVDLETGFTLARSYARRYLKAHS